MRIQAAAGWQSLEEGRTSGFQMSQLGTSVKKCSSSPVLRRCPGAAGVLVKISSGSHQSSSSMNQGAGQLFSPHREGQEGWHQAQSSQKSPQLLSTAFEAAAAGGVLFCNLKYVFCWPHS